MSILWFFVKSWFCTEIPTVDKVVWGSGFWASKSWKFVIFVVTSNKVISATMRFKNMIRSAFELRRVNFFKKFYENNFCLNAFDVWLHLRKYEAVGAFGPILNPSKMTILPQTLLETVVDEVEWSQIFFFWKKYF